MSALAPRVSVVIPAYNAEATLAETLASVQAQSDTDWEAIVVDDRSTDGTAALLARAAASEPRLRVLAGAHRGVSAARNVGIAAARGELIAFLDADDLWRPEKLQRHVAQFERQPALGLAFARILFVDVDGRSTGVLSTPRVRRLRAADYLYENPACTASTLVARRAVLAELGGFDETMRFGEDLELLLRVACHPHWQVDGLDAVLTHYRASPRGLSSDLEAMQAGWETLIAKVGAYAPEMVARHLNAARAVHLRYLARRALRLGLPPSRGLQLFGRALRSHPLALLREPRRSVGTLAALCLQAATASLRPTPRHP